MGLIIDQVVNGVDIHDEPNSTRIQDVDQLLIDMEAGVILTELARKNKKNKMCDQEKSKKMISKGNFKKKGKRYVKNAYKANAQQDVFLEECEIANKLCEDDKIGEAKHT